MTAIAITAPLASSARLRVLGAAGVAALDGFLFGFDTSRTSSSPP